MHVALHAGSAKKSLSAGKACHVLKINHFRSHPQVEHHVGAMTEPVLNILIRPIEGFMNQGENWNILGGKADTEMIRHGKVHVNTGRFFEPFGNKAVSPEFKPAVQHVLIDAVHVIVFPIEFRSGARLYRMSLR